MLEEELKNEVDFRFFPDEDSSSLALVELLTGKYKGVIFSYGKVAVEEKEELDSAVLSFDFDIKDSNGIENLSENEEFKNHLGNILFSVILETAKNDKVE